MQRTASNRDGGTALAAAIRDITSASKELAALRTSSDAAEPQRLESLQNLLRFIQTTDEQAQAAKQRGAPPGAVTEYAAALRAALTEIELLEQILDGRRRSLSPRLDAAVREQEFRSAYARALSRR